jgi:hypothetical protein
MTQQATGSVSTQWVEMKTLAVRYKVKAEKLDELLPEFEEIIEQ